MLRRVFLGIKLIKGTNGLAHHWAIGVGNVKEDDCEESEVIWMELDGVDEKKAIFGNPPSTINGHGANS